MRSVDAMLILKKEQLMNEEIGTRLNKKNKIPICLRALFEFGIESKQIEVSTKNSAGKTVDIELYVSCNW